MSKRDELAAVLSWSSGEFTRWSPDAHPDHNHWSWQGNGHGERARRPFREQADAVLAWLGEQFDEGLRETFRLTLRNTALAVMRDVEHGDAALATAVSHVQVLAAITLLRTRLGLSDAAQDAQDGAVGPGSVRMGTGEGAAPNGAQIEDFEGER